MDSLDLVAVDDLVHDEGPDTCAKRDGRERAPQGRHLALAPQDALVGEGQLARHGEEQLACIKLDARAKRGLAREPLLEEPFPGGEAIGAWVGVKRLFERLVAHGPSS